MKTSRGFTQPNRILSFLRFGSGVTLISAAAAMAFVAANNSSPLLSGKSGVKREASSVRSKDFANNFRRLHHGAFETSLAAVKGGGEPESIDGAAQEDYDNRAYPATSIGVCPAASRSERGERRSPSCRAARKRTGRRSARAASPASALVASESTGAISRHNLLRPHDGDRDRRRTATRTTARSSSAQRAAACGRRTTRSHRSPTGIRQATASHRTQSAPSPSIPTTRTGRPSTSERVNRTARATPRRASVSTSQPTSASPGRSCRAARHRRRRARPAWAHARSRRDDQSAQSRSIRPIANHIFIGTDVARHGSSSVNGGRFTPPGAATSRPLRIDGRRSDVSFDPEPSFQDAVDPSNPTGDDFFRGGASRCRALPRGGRDAGLRLLLRLRRVPALARRWTATPRFHQIFRFGRGRAPRRSRRSSRTEFSLAPNGSNLRIYVGDAERPGGSRADSTGSTTPTWRRRRSSPAARTAAGRSCPTRRTARRASHRSTIARRNAPTICRSTRRRAPRTSSTSAGRCSTSEIGGTVERPRGPAVGGRRRELHGHDDRHTGRQPAPGSARDGGDAARTRTSSSSADDGGVWRMNGSFTDVSSQCASRGSRRRQPHRLHGLALEGADDDLVA